MVVISRCWRAAPAPGILGPMIAVPALLVALQTLPARLDPAAVVTWATRTGKLEG